MDAMFEQFLERQGRLDRDPKTIALTRQVLGQFEEHLEVVGVAPAEVESWVVEEYVLGKRVARETKRHHLVYIGAAYRYARRRRQVAHDPTEGIQLPTVPDREPKIIPPDDLRALYAAIRGRRDEMGFHLLAYAGLRRTEAAKMREEHVDLDGHTLRVNGKQGKFRLVPIHPALWDVLERRLDGIDHRPLLRGRGIQQVNPTYFGMQMTELATRAGVEATPHDFRRTVASSLYRNGVQADTIDRLMGWAPRTVRSRYYLNVADDQLQSAILRLYQDSPISNPPKR